ncbi:hypothetical protein [Paenibacillus camerounensis]|uniref:hypothetical protein n=1 Tax=Paenibacillus camerounensis TaxID=1243663 RepID=UPI0005AB0B5B|nr:hypothetical protein [Paenibacillus camerounensis]
MGAKVLKVSKPLLTTSNIYGTLFSIISDEKNLEPWIYSNFIQLRYVIDWNVYFFDNHDLLFETCPYVTKTSINRELINRWTSFKEFITYSIDENLYIWCHLDRFFIPSFSEYQNNNRFHETLIYGYDTEKNIIYISDNLQGGAYKTTQCTFEEAEAAFQNVESEYEFINKVNLIKKNSIIDFDSHAFNREYLIDSLQRYLYSKRSFDLINPKVLNIYGLNVYHHLISTITHHKKDTPKLDIRVFHLLWEHKKLMVMRLEYLHEISCLTESGDLIDKYKKLEKKSLIIRNLALRYEVSRKLDDLTKIESGLVEIMNSERELLEKLISNI